jgi:hypothetical protein
MWSGGYLTWAGGHGMWSGSEPWAGSLFADNTFVASFEAGESPVAAISNATISFFLQDQ